MACPAACRSERRVRFRHGGHVVDVEGGALERERRVS